MSRKVVSQKPCCRSLANSILYPVLTKSPFSKQPQRFLLAHGKLRHAAYRHHRSCEPHEGCKQRLGDNRSTHSTDPHVSKDFKASTLMHEVVWHQEAAHATCRSLRATVPASLFISLHANGVGEPRACALSSMGRLHSVRGSCQSCTDPLHMASAWACQASLPEMLLSGISGQTCTALAPILVALLRCQTSVGLIV